MNERGCKHDWVAWKDNLQTRIVTSGKRGIREQSDFSESEELFLIIPGNPGLSGFYELFMSSLQSRLGNQNLSIWAISHIGHDSLNPSSLPTHQTFSFEDQICHKLHFLDNYVSRKTRVTLLGHSVGCKIIMEIVKRNTTHNFVGSYFLFPMVEGMALTARGQEVKPSTSYLRLPLVYLLTVIYLLMPTKLLLWMVSLVLRGVDKAVQDAVLALANPNSLNNVLVMAAHELETIKELDVETIEKMRGKLRIYFAGEDGWCPDQFRDHLRQALNCTDDCIIDENDFKHAFVLRSGKELGEIIADWTLKKMNNK